MTQSAPPAYTAMQPPETVAQAKSLRAWLTVFQVLAALYGGMVLLSLLPLLAMPAILASESSIGVEAPPTGLLLLMVGLMLVLVVIAVGALIYLLAWGKEWVEKVAVYLYPKSAWTTLGPSTGDPRPRLQALAETLGKWMVTSAWATVIFLGLGVLFNLAVFALLGSLGSELEELGLGTLLPVFSIFGLASNVLVGVLSWQIFMRLRDYFAEATAALGRSAAGVASASQRLQQWLMYWVWYLVVVGSAFTRGMNHSQGFEDNAQSSPLPKPGRKHTSKQGTR